MKKKNQIKKVTKPFMKGDAVDRTTLSKALKFFAAFVVMAVVFLIVCVMMTMPSAWLTFTLNAAIIIGAYLMYMQFGMSSGADAVNQGEIMYARQEKGRPVAAWERSMCYHPLKGFLAALIGSAPILLCSILLACTAQRQMTGLGTLPSWVSGLEGRQEVGNALAYYHEVGSLDLETLMRLIVRMTTMPYINIIGAGNSDAILLFERLSPIVNLLPAVAYGLGYVNGISVRTSVHTNIALGKKKAKRKQAKERRARRVNRGPEQLN